jgi:hypothetical protein
MQELVDLVQTVGLPIALCIYLLWDKRQSENTNAKELSDALNEMTQTLTELKTFLQTKLC